MTFLKRHWPDVLIVAVIAVLLSGFLLVLLGRPQVTLTLPFGTAASTPGPRVEPAEPVAPPQATVTQTPAVPAASAPDVASVEPQVQEIPTIPAAPAVTQGDLPNGETATATVEAATRMSLPPARDVVATSRPGVPTRSDYRIGAGVHADEATARVRTAAINELGYVVHMIAVEQGVVAQIGPFATQEDAERAQQQIRAVYTPLTLQPPLGQTLARSAEGITQDAAAPAVNADANAPATIPSAASPSAGTYLQVGAFSTNEYAAPLIERLRAEGFTPSVNAPPGQKIRVLLGPFAPDALQSARKQLDTLGIQHFQVR